MTTPHGPLDAPTPEQSLARYLEMQAVVSDVLSTLVKAPPGSTRGAVDRALSVLGGFCAVDRVYLFDVHGDRISNTHEWCATGIPAEIDNLQDLPLDVVQAWVRPLRAGREVVVADVDALGPDRADERELLSSQGIRSLLVVPVLAEGQLVGFAGFDSVRRIRTFLPGEVVLLRSATDVIASTLTRSRADHRARTADARLAAITKSVTDLVAVVDADLRTTYASESHRSIDADPAGLVGTPWSSLLDATHATALHAAVASLDGHHHTVVVGDVQMSAAHGSSRWLEVKLSDLRDDDAISGILLTAHEVTDRRRAEEQLAFEATHDLLTNLPNRQMLMERAGLAGAEGGDLALLFIDIDRFKMVNDTMGHAAGDDLLVAVAARLRLATAGHLLARFGGDEFVVLIADATPQVVDRIVVDIRDSMQSGIDLSSGRHIVTVSIGSAASWTTGRDPEALLRDADMAMYMAKDQGRNRSVIFDNRFRARAVRRGQLFRLLPDAVECGAIAVVYQPILALASDTVTGVEALARWSPPELGAVPPGEFIGVAEELGLIGRIGVQVMRIALAEVAAVHPGRSASVNLSPRQLTDPNLVGHVAKALEATGTPADRLVVEVTESILVDQPTTTRRTLTALRDMGVRVALDDFGTGYSSLSQLRDLPIDILKVDRSFVARLTESDRDHRFVRAIVSLGTDLGMTVTAEGVEEPEQLEVVRHLGAHHAQGYLIGRPAPLRDAATVAG